MLTIKTYGIQDHTGTGNLYVTVPSVFAQPRNIVKGTKLIAYMRVPQKNAAPYLIFATVPNKRHGTKIGEYSVASQGKRGLQIKIPVEFIQRVKLKANLHALECSITDTAVFYRKSKA